jgi:YVTN family beta-propeller protein
VLPNSQYVYVSNVNQGTGVAVIRASDNALLRCIPVPGGSGDIAALPDGNYVYVASYDSSLVSVIRTSDDSIVARIRVGTGPTCVAAAPGGECVYVVNKDSGTISVIGY